MIDKLDPQVQNNIIQNTVKSTVMSQFPIVGKQQSLILVGNLEIDDQLDEFDFPKQKETKLAGGSWNIPLFGHIRLIDNKTGKMIDEVKKLRIANIPKMTNRFSMLIDGNEYTTINQFVLKPGVYTRKKANDEMESRFNLAVGYNFTMMMMPGDGVFYIYVGAQKFHVYTLLHAFGIADAEMEKYWGKDLLEKNRVAGINEGDKEIPLLWEKLKRQKTDYNTALIALKDYFDKTRLSVDTTELTLGKGFDRVTTETLLYTSKKLLSVLRGELPEDERDSLLFKNLRTVDDLLGEYIQKNSNTIQKNLTTRTDNKTNIREIISSDTYTTPLKRFFTTGDLSNPSPQTNPIEMIGEWRKTTITGTGGIQSPHAITFKTRDVHPTHLGFIDPLLTPESSKVGVTLSLATHTIKDDDGLKVPIITSKGKFTYITPTQFYKLKIGLPDQHDGGKPKSDVVKAMYRGVPTILDKDVIDGYLPHPSSMFSIQTNLVPFLGHNSGNRALVAAKMASQSVSLENPHAPIVKVRSRSGRTYDNVLGNYLNPKVPEDFGKAVVTKIDSEYITLKNEKGSARKIGLYDNFPLNQESFIHSIPIVKVGDKVESLQTLAHTNFNDSDGNYAVGINATVAYMPWYGYNFEDGAVITESLAKQFTSEVIIKKTIQIESDSILDLKKFQAYYPSVITGDNLMKLDDSGIIKEGSRVKHSDILVAHLQKTDLTDTERVLRQMNRMISQPYKNKSLEWDEENEGDVLYIRRVGKSINVYIKIKQPMVVGDKLAGRYGDKHIVTRIIPDNEAPHTPDGTRINIMVNPHGVIGRMNMGQLLEAAAGKLSTKTKEPYIVDNFDGKNHLNHIVSELKKNNIPIDEKLRLGKDGKYTIAPVFWGVKHYLKLIHIVEHKYKSRGLPGTYDSNEQPAHSQEAPGQTIDPLQTFSLLAHGSTENLYEMAAIKGQKNDEYWRQLQLGIPPTPPQHNFIFDKMLAYMRGAGINIAKDGYKLTVFPATSADVLKLSNGELTDARQILRGKDLTAISGGLFDPKITGGANGDKWTHIKLAEEMPNPLYEPAIKIILGLNSTQYDNIMNEGISEDGNTGAKLIKHKLSKLNVGTELEKAENALRKAPPTAVNTLNRRVRYLQTLSKFKLSPVNAYMMTVVPVLPPKFRPIYPLPSGDIQVAPINKHYRVVALINESINDIRKAGIDDQEFNKDNRVNLYQSLKAMTGLIDPIGYTKEKYEGLLGTLAGTSPKQGLVQSKVWSRRQDLSARTTITVEPSLGIDEVGVPDSILKDIFHPFIVQEIVRQGYTPVKALEEFKNWSPVADKALDNVVRKRNVLLNRAPSLHKHSVQAFKPLRMEGSSIRLNPLIFTGLNADMDGDVMSVHVPISDKAQAESTLMFPSKNLFKAGDKSQMNTLAQDYQLGLYYLSVPGKNTGKSFNSLAEIEKAKLNPQDTFTYKGKKTTWGQLMINSKLPKELQDTSRLLDSKETKKLLEKLYNDYPTYYSEVINHFKELGRTYATERGSTISILDMQMNRDFREDILKQYSKKITPKSTAQEIDTLYSKAKEEIEKKQNTAVKDTNRFYEMLNSGSSGKKDQVVQILSMPGIFRNVHGEPIPHPVTKSWSEGLDAFDYFNTTYGARKGVVDRSVNTQDSGALNKELLFNTKNLLIVEDDCGTPEGIEIEIDSKDAKDRYLLKDISGVGKRNDLIDVSLVEKARKKKLVTISVRSPLTCEADGGICVKCYGLMANGQPPRLGENVGVIDAQSVSERSCNHAKSLIILKNLTNIKITSIEELFNEYIYLPKVIDAIYNDTEIIDLSELNLEVYDGNDFTKLYRIGRHKPTAEMMLIKTKEQSYTICQANHPLPIYKGKNICTHCDAKIYAASVHKKTRTNHAACSYCGKRSNNKIYTPPYEMEWIKQTSTQIRLFTDYVRQPKEIYEKIRLIGNYKQLPLTDYWAGFYLAEGHIAYGKTRKGLPRITGFGIRQIPDNHMHLLMEDNPQYAWKMHTTAKDRVWCWKVHGKETGLLFQNLFGRYSHNKHLPNDFIHYEDQKLLRILAGIIDGDGYYDKGAKYFTISTNSFYLIQQISIISQLLKFHTLVVTDSDNGIMGHQGMKITCQFTNEQLTYLSNFSYKIKLHLEEVRKFNEFISSDFNYISLIRPIKYEEEFVYDVDTESHLCQYGNIQSHNTQLTMSSFHSGGAGVGAAITRGFPRLEELIFVHKKITDAAVISKEVGIVRDITPNVAGGVDVLINETKYYIPRERQLKIQIGSRVLAGDALTDGSIRPQELSQYKNHLTAQLYVADEIDNIYEKKFARKTFETVLRGISNNAEITNIPEDTETTWLKGDTVPLNTVKKMNRELVEQGKSKIEYMPYFAPVDILPMYSKDWLSRLTTNRLVGTLQEAPAQGMETNVKGTDPLTAYLHATTFGQDLNPKEKKFY